MVSTFSPMKTSFISKIVNSFLNDPLSSFSIRIALPTKLTSAKLKSSHVDAFPHIQANTDEPAPKRKMAKNAKSSFEERTAKWDIRWQTSYLDNGDEVHSFFFVTNAEGQPRNGIALRGYKLAVKLTSPEQTHTASLYR